MKFITIAQLFLSIKALIILPVGQLDGLSTGDSKLWLKFKAYIHMENIKKDVLGRPQNF